MPAPIPAAGRPIRSDGLHPDVGLSFRDARWSAAHREARLYAEDALRHRNPGDALAAFQARYGDAARWRGVFEIAHEQHRRRTTR